MADDAPLAAPIPVHRQSLCWHRSPPGCQGDQAADSNVDGRAFYAAILLSAITIQASAFHRNRCRLFTGFRTIDAQSGTCCPIAVDEAAGAAFAAASCAVPGAIADATSAAIVASEATSSSSKVRGSEPRMQSAPMTIPSTRSGALGGITQAGNGRARRVLIEAAWAYCHPARVGYEKQRSILRPAGALQSRGS